MIGHRMSAGAGTLVTLVTLVCVCVGGRGGEGGANWQAVAKGCGRQGANSQRQYHPKLMYIVLFAACIALRQAAVRLRAGPVPMPLGAKQVSAESEVQMAEKTRRQKRSGARRVRDREWARGLLAFADKRKRTGREMRGGEMGGSETPIRPRPGRLALISLPHNG